MAGYGRTPGSKNDPESRLRNGAELRNCLICGVEFWVPRWQRETVKGGGKFCSRQCKHAAQRGVELTAGTRYLRKDGYVTVKLGIRKYDLEHRVVAERSLGRPLKSGEQVHHINGVKHDNRPENLEVVTNAEHQRLHNHIQTRPRRIAKACDRCGAAYHVKASKATQSRYCSNACRLAALHQGNRRG